MVDILDRVIEQNKLQHVLEGLHKRTVKLALLAPHITEYEFTILKDYVVASIFASYHPWLNYHIGY